MQLKTITYTSLASFDLTDDQLNAIHHTARNNNALEGITGLLIFNGTHFLQVIEGAEQAIDNLVEKLMRDPRHHSLEIQNESPIDDRRFPDWSMELVRVESNYFIAKESVENRLPAQLPDATLSSILELTKMISTDVRMPR